MIGREESRCSGEQRDVPPEPGVRAGFGRGNCPAVSRPIVLKMPGVTSEHSAVDVGCAVKAV